jgi:hypothetical protein
MSTGPAGTALPPIFFPRALRLCTARGPCLAGDLNMRCTKTSIIGMTNKHDGALSALF